MSRSVIMQAVSFYNGAWLNVTGKPTPPLPDLVADKLIERGRAVEVEDAQAMTKIEGAGIPVKLEKRNRGADAVVDAPLPEPVSDLPDIKADPDPE